MFFGDFSDRSLPPDICGAFHLVPALLEPHPRFRGGSNDLKLVWEEGLVSCAGSRRKIKNGRRGEKKTSKYFGD